MFDSFFKELLIANKMFYRNFEVISSCLPVKMLDNIVTATFDNTYEMTMVTVIFVLSIIICLLLFSWCSRSRHSQQDATENAVLKAEEYPGEPSTESQQEIFDLMSCKTPSTEVEEVNLSESPKELQPEKCDLMPDKNSTAETGELCETLGQVRIEWEIKEFLSLLKEEKKNYRSPKIYFSKSCWCIQICSNSEINDGADNYIGFYLTRMTNGSPVRVDFTLEIKTKDEENLPSMENIRDFNEKDETWGNPNFISIQELMQRKEELAPSETLTVICMLDKKDPDGVTDESSDESPVEKCCLVTDQNSATEIGKIYETFGLVKIEWNIEDFFSLSHEIRSPKCYFYRSVFQARIHPKAEICDANGDWIGLYLTRMEQGSPVTVKFSLSIPTDDEKNYPCVTNTRDFIEKGDTLGNPNFILRQELMQRKEELAPSDVLTVICMLESEVSHDVRGMPMRKKNTSGGRLSTTGDLSITQGELSLEWKIVNFFPLPDAKKKFVSPYFYFSGSSWYVELSIYNIKKDESEQWIELYLYKGSTGLPVRLNYSLKVNTLDGKIYAETDEKNSEFPKKDNGWGRKKFISSSQLMKMKSELSASDDIVVLCNIKKNESYSITRSFFHRLLDVADNLKEIFDKEKRTDCKLKFNDGTIAAHRVILETRSPVIATMFSHADKENKTGEIYIENIEIDTMEAILEYLYNGDLIQLTTDNALTIYSAADKFDIKYIKEMCLDFIIQNLSKEWVCDVIKFAKLYNEDEIGCRAREYFKDNAREILETEEWEYFSEENQDLGLELLSLVVKSLV